MQDSFFVCLKFYNDNFQNQLDKQLLRGYILHIVASPSSRGLGHRVLIPATWVRIPLEMPFFLSFFPRIVSNPCKKQSSAGKCIFRRGFFFLRLFFAAQKMGLLTCLWVAVALSSIALRAKEDALRLVGLRPPSNPIGDAIFLSFFKES